MSYRALPIHEPFHRSGEFDRHMFGAVGSGKTYGVCAEAIAWCLEQPGIRGLVTRKTIPELRDTTETVFFDILPDELYRAGTALRAGGHYEKFVFPNGSTVLFRSIDDWKKHKSLNLGFIAWDEMDEFDEETFIGMKTRLRQRDPTKEGRAWGAREITRRGTWGASNPAGRNWLYDHYIKHANGAHFTSTSFDNPYLTPDYFTTLLQMPEPWIKRYVLCQFDDFAGQMYENWGWDSHVVGRYALDALSGGPLYPPQSLFMMGFDPGTRSPSGGLWVVAERLPQPRLVAVAEYVEPGLDAKAHARAWRRIEAQHRFRQVRRVADPNSITVRDRGSNMRLQDIYQRLGFRFDLGPSGYDDRFLSLGTLIDNGQFVVTEDCPMTFEAIRDARWKDLTPAQRQSGETPAAKPLKKDRELVDCAEYVAGRWVKPVAPTAVAPENVPEWQWQIQQSIKKRHRNARRRPAATIEGIPVA